MRERLPIEIKCSVHLKGGRGCNQKTAKMAKKANNEYFCETAGSY